VDLGQPTRRFAAKHFLPPASWAALLGPQRLPCARRHDAVCRSRRQSSRRPRWRLPLGADMSASAMRFLSMRCGCRGPSAHSAYPTRSSRETGTCGLPAAPRTIDGECADPRLNADANSQAVRWGAPASVVILQSLSADGTKGPRSIPPFPLISVVPCPMAHRRNASSSPGPFPGLARSPGRLWPAARTEHAVVVSAPDRRNALGSRWTLTRGAHAASRAQLLRPDCPLRVLSSHLTAPLARPYPSVTGAAV